MSGDASDDDANDDDANDDDANDDDANDIDAASGCWKVHSDGAGELSLIHISEPTRPC